MFPLLFGHHRRPLRVLLLTLALAGRGRFATAKPTEHARTAATVIEHFLRRKSVFQNPPDGPHQVLVR